ncbi:MAG: cardiolipin synthase B [Nitrospirae bacterium]|nr:cardiolipin synthase B [Nitrospirota bacterium]
MYDPRSPADSVVKETAVEKAAIENILGVPFTEKNHVRLLKSGKEIFQAIFDSVANAKEIICIEFYIFKNDATGNKMADLLKEKAGLGVNVYILYDHFGSLTTPLSFWQDLKKAGINLRASHPFKWSAPRRYIHRDHKKLLIIDGETAFTGGFNIGDEYHGYIRKWKQPWRDTGIYLKGPVAAILLDMFKNSWTAWKGQPIKLDNINQPVPGGIPVIPVLTSSAKGRKKLRKLFFHSISSAKNKIFITNAYFTPSRRMLTVLSDAVKRGVDVKILLPGKSDIAPVFYASRAFYSRLLRAGVEIYNYQNQILHAKTAVIDTCRSIIGSANLDFQSLRRNDESNVGILNNDFGSEMTKIFFEDLTQSVRIDAHTWPKRPFYEKVLERFFSIFRTRF